MTIATVVGLGKIGLPLAVQVAGAGVVTWGVDIDSAVIDTVSAGVPPFPGEPELEDRLAAGLRAGTLHPTLDVAGAVEASDVVVVVVPLVVDAEARPDFGAVDAATAAVAPCLRPGTLVVYETTLPVGTTRDRFVPALAAGSGLPPGELLVAHSPERVSSGSVFRDLRRYPKLVGGVDAASGARAVAFYEEVLDFDERPDLPRPNGVWDLGGAEAAELTKLAETTYRDLNIGFANELATYAERLGVDVADVIAAANSQPYSHLHTPGFVGGHCIPVYPWFLLAGAPELRLPRTAREVNDATPAHVVDVLAAAAAGGLEGRRVAVLGLAYRGGVKELAFSGALALVEVLRSRGATPVVHDPLWTADELRGLGFEPYALGEPCHAAIVQADHPEYRTLSPADIPGAVAVFDVRRCTPVEGWAAVRRLVLGAPRHENL